MRPDYDFRPAWGRDDARIISDAKDFWRELKLLGPQEIERRAGELCMAAYCAGRIVAVSTASLDYVDQLQSRCAMFRCAVARDHRRHHLAYEITGRTRALLEQWSLEHPQDGIAGMAAIIQSAELRVHFTRQPVWSEYGANLHFAGYTDRNEQLRIAWFEHAQVPERRPTGLTQRALGSVPQ
jgi:hypothetical protein